MTNTGVKFVIVVEGGGVEEAGLKALFREVHTAWIGVVMNPFYTEGRGVGRGFVMRVEELGRAWGVESEV